MPVEFPSLSSISPVPSPPSRLVGGVVAHNEERLLGPAVRSLLDQQLPPGVSWECLVVVASGCTDRTVEVAERLARDDPLVQLTVEPTRRGKAAALNHIIRRSQGNPMVLLNADARAGPGAVEALLAVGTGQTVPYAVMGRPCAPGNSPRPAARLAALLWALHHEFHRSTLGTGRGNHLSDELLFVHAPAFPGFPEGVINDGAYLGAWLDAQGGARLYAPEARVGIQVPESLGDYLKQRRRILVGHAQVDALLGTRPTTLPRLALSDPAEAARIFGRTARDDPWGFLDLVALAGPELLAALLAAWDRVPPRRDHTLWDRISNELPWPQSPAP